MYRCTPKAVTSDILRPLLKTLNVMKPTLILDIDGVVLRWNSQLVAYLQTKGPVDPEISRKIMHNEYLDLSFMDMDAIFEYHRSIFIEKLSPFEATTVSSIKTLANDYNLVALTSFSADPQAQEARVRNLEMHFPGCFSEVIILPTLSAKKVELEILAQRLNVIGFVDDSPKHIVESLAVLGYDRTYWFNSYRHDDSLECKKISSLNDMVELLQLCANASEELAVA